MNKIQSVEKGISEIAGVFTDPIIVFPGGWGDTLPEWLKNAVTLERLEMNMRALKGEEMTGTGCRNLCLSLHRFLDSADGPRLGANLSQYRHQDLQAMG